MLDLATKEGKIISSALRLAAETPWQDVTLRQIASSASLTLADLSETFSSKSDILKGFLAQVDKEVLATAPPPRDGETRRDALFEVIMARFDALTPYKTSLRSIANSPETELSLIRPLLKSQVWMLEAAGIGSDGPMGPIKAAGLASVYMSAFRTWLDDDDPGMARTMAVLDRRLRRGEQAVSGMESAFEGVQRVKSMLKSVLVRPRSTTDAESAQTDDVASTANSNGPDTSAQPAT